MGLVSRAVTRFIDWLKKNGALLQSLAALLAILTVLVAIIGAIGNQLVLPPDSRRSISEAELQSILENIKDKKGIIEEVLPWWEKVCEPGKCGLPTPVANLDAQHTRLPDGFYDPIALAKREGCYGFAWGVEDEARNVGDRLLKRTVVVFTKKAYLKFAPGVDSDLVVVCITHNIKVTADQAGRIQETACQEIFPDSGGIWTHVVRQ
jgi:hypothetical protein